MRREDVAELLHKAVGKVRLKQRDFLQHRVGAPLHGEEERHFVGAELVDHQEGVFAILLGDIVNIAVHIFPATGRCWNSARIWRRISVNTCGWLVPM